MCQNINEQYFVAYFDFLGFKEYVKDNPLNFMVSDYKNILKKIESEKEIYFDSDTIICHWFSDTFLFCAKLDQDNFEKVFCQIQTASMEFFEEMMCSNNPIPLRGALTVGEFYTEPEHDIFLGEALIKAYEYAENIDWLGFVLTPEILTLLKQDKRENEINFCNRHYVEHEVPYKENKKKEKPTRLLALRLDQFNQDGGNVRLFWDRLGQMEGTAPKKAKVKYQNTQEFMLKNCPQLKKLIDKENL